MNKFYYVVVMFFGPCMVWLFIIDAYLSLTHVFHTAVGMMLKYWFCIIYFI